MKKKDLERKLQLHKESLRCLTERELTAVEGAAPDTNTRRSCFSCDRTCTC